MDMIKQALRLLFPPGHAWTLTGTLGDLVDALAESFARLRLFFRGILTESLPGTADDTLLEWYETLGLKYDPTQGLSARQARADQAYTSVGGQNKDYLEEQIQRAYPGVYLVEVEINIQNMVGIGMAGHMQAQGYPSWVAPPPTDGSFPVHHYQVVGEVDDAIDLKGLQNLLSRIAPLTHEPVFQITIRNQTSTSEVGLGMVGLAEAGRGRIEYITDGLLGWWKLNKGTGLIAHDSTAYGNDGALEGAAPSWVDGKIGKCVSFPGTDERIDCGNPSPLDQIGNGDFTICFFMKSKDITPLNYGVLFDKYQDASGFITLSSDAFANRVFLEIKKDGTGVASPFSVGSAPFDTIWNHIVLVINRITDKALLYMNTVKDATEMNISMIAFDASNTGRLAWGAANDGWSPYEGLLDDLRIYNRILTEPEIEKIYNLLG